MTAPGQVSWLSDLPTPRAFPAFLASGPRGFRPRLQWRGRGGFAPPSLCFSGHPGHRRRRHR